MGGLCNRMRTIASAVKLAKKLNCKMKVLWVKYKALNAPFKSLFEPIPYPVIETSDGSFFHHLFSFVYKTVLQYKLLDDNWIGKKARGKDEKIWFDEVEDKNLYIESCSDIYKDCGVYDIFNPLSQFRNM